MQSTDNDRGTSLSLKRRWDYGQYGRAKPKRVKSTISDNKNKQLGIEMWNHLRKYLSAMSDSVGNKVFAFVPRIVKVYYSQCL